MHFTSTRHSFCLQLLGCSSVHVRTRPYRSVAQPWGRLSWKLNISELQFSSHYDDDDDDDEDGCGCYDGNDPAVSATINNYSRS
jgi:hypothetical protein